MILDSISTMAPTAALLMFAIMFFGIMIDVGLFDPLIRLITRLLGDDPAKVVLGTAILAGAVSLDGDGSTTFIITTSAMLPIYLRLGMSPVVLTCVAGLMNGTLNIVPWADPPCGPRPRSVCSRPTSSCRCSRPGGRNPGDVELRLAARAGGAASPRPSRLRRAPHGRRRRCAVDRAEDLPRIRREARGRCGAAHRQHRRGRRRSCPVPAASVDPADTAMADTMLDPERPTLRRS